MFWFEIIFLCSLVLEKVKNTIELCRNKFIHFTRILGFLKKENQNI